jgi:ribosome-associated protein
VAITTGRRTGEGELIMRDVVLRKEPVELHKILKFEGMVPSGGVAKLAIESGDVMVNGEVETRKRKKMVGGDIIEFNGEQIRLVTDG